jgi:hypothetical protein
VAAREWWRSTARPHTTAWTSRGINALQFALCLLLLSTTVADADLWGHLRFGIDILTTRAIPRTDTYSFMTAGTPWIDHEWLSEVLFGGTYVLAGISGLIVLKTLIAMGVIVLVWRELIRHGLPPLRALIPVLPLALSLQPALATVRPQVFTVVGFTLMMLLLGRYDERGGRILWLLPVIFVPWANLHGGFLAGVGILLVWLAVRLFLAPRRAFAAVAPRDGLKRTLTDEAAPVALALLATIANPYGVGLAAFLLRTATVPRPEIAEWQPLPVFSFVGASYLVVLVLTAAAIRSGRRTRPAALLAVYACLALAPLDAMRHLPLFAVGSVLIAAPHLPGACERWLGAYREPRARWLVPALAAVALLFVARAVPHFAALQDDPSFPVPTRAMALLEATRSPGRLAVDFNWGEYAIWLVGPRIQVSVDGRRETVYSEAAYQANLRFMFGGAGWDSLLDRQHADLALVRRGSPADRLLRHKPGWRLVYDDVVCAMFASDDSAVGAELRNIPDGNVRASDGQGGPRTRS